MLESYLFIPGNKENYFNKISSLNPDFFVIDLEDAVSSNNRKSAYELIMKFKFPPTTYVRIPIMEKCFNNDEMATLIRKFNGQIIFPKISYSKDLEILISLVPSDIILKLILLVENPKCYMNLENILTENLDVIQGIGFGSHDFCSSLGMKHESKYIDHYKKQIIVICRAFEVRFVDTVDLNFNKIDSFKQDCINSFNLGADGKFIIHPNQLKAINEASYLSEQEIENYSNLLIHINNISDEDIDVIEFNGEIYEKPHIQKIRKMLKKIKNI